MCIKTILVLISEQTRHVALIFRSKKICKKILKPDLVKIQYDCTFETTPREFVQTMNIMATYRGAKIPVWTCILTSKKVFLYTAILKKFSQEYPCIKPKLIQSDFEAALHLAAKLVYPSASVRGCWLHYSSACYKQFKKRGLVKFYQSDRKVRRICRKIMALPILPASKICDQIDYIYNTAVKTLPDPTAQKLLIDFNEEYLIKFWIKQIGPARMSVYGCPDKTNNATEQLHSLMHTNMPKHPVIFNFAYWLKRTIYNPYQVKLAQLDDGKKIGFPHPESEKIQE